jgi:thermitase
MRNANDCHAVTYYVRRVMEVYDTATRVVAVEWRIGDSPWRTVQDMSEQAAGMLGDLRKAMPELGEERKDERPVTLPTDGTLYEAELAHCSSCDPMHEAKLRIELEHARLRNRRDCLEAEGHATGTTEG